MPNKKLVFNTFLVVTSVCFSIAVVESLLRAVERFQARYSTEAAQEKALAWVETHRGDAYDRGDAHSELYDSFAKMRYSGYLGYFPAPHVEGEGYRTNDRGFRNDEDVPDPKPQGELWVFVVGGSTAWGAGVGQADTYAVHLQSLLQNELGERRVRVWNAGVGAYLSTHERILVVNQISRLKPDVVVHVSGWNDTYAGYRGYEVTDDRWDYTASAAILGKYHKLFVYDEGAARMTDPEPPQRWHQSWALLYAWDRVVYPRRMADRKRPVESVVENLVENLRLAHSALKPTTVHVFALQPTLYASTKVLSEWEQAEVARNDARDPNFGAYNAEIYARYRSELPDRLREIGVGFLDLDPGIAEEPRSVFADHVHFGDRGNRLIAARLVDSLMPALKDGSAPPMR